MEPKTLLDTDVLSGLMRKTPAALNRARTYLADCRRCPRRPTYPASLPWRVATVR